MKNNVLSLHLLSLNCPTQQLEETVFCVLLYIASLSGCVGRGPSCLASKNNEVYLSCWLRVCWRLDLKVSSHSQHWTLSSYSCYFYVYPLYFFTDAVPFSFKSVPKKNCTVHSIWILLNHPFFDFMSIFSLAVFKCFDKSSSKWKQLCGAQLGEHIRPGFWLISGISIRHFEGCCVIGQMLSGSGVCLCICIWTSEMTEEVV